MKKVLLIAAVAGLSMASCRKDRTCECTTTSDAPGFVSSTTTYTWKKTKKRDARVACQTHSDIETQPVAGTYHSGEDCKLK